MNSILSTAPTYLPSWFALLTVCIAILGLNTWNKQIKGNIDRELLKELINSWVSYTSEFNNATAVIERSINLYINLGQDSKKNIYEKIIGNDLNKSAGDLWKTNINLQEILTKIQLIKNIKDESFNPISVFYV